MAGGGWYRGNAGVDGAPRRGWLVGHVVDDPDDVRRSKDVEVTWGVHPAGEARAGWSTGEYRTTVVLLVRARFCVECRTGAVVLTDEGDYVMWRAGLDHSWRAESDSVVVTIWWPSS